MKIIKIIVINILSIFLIAIFINIYALCLFNYSQYTSNKKNVFSNVDKIKFFIEGFSTYGIKSLKKESFDQFYNNFKKGNEFRDTILTNNSAKRPILLFGCSYVWGGDLEYEQSLSYKLANLSGRNVYNRAVFGTGVQHFPYILEHFELEKEIDNPEYIIFVYSIIHNSRMYRKIIFDGFEIPEILYKAENGELVQQKNELSPLFRLYLHRKIYLEKFYKDFYKPKEEVFELLKLQFLKAHKLIEKKFPNTKTVIILWNDCDDKECSWYYNNSEWNELKEAGYIIIDVRKLIKSDKNLSDKTYTAEDNAHPNEYVWDLVTPALVKKLNL